MYLTVYMSSFPLHQLISFCTSESIWPAPNHEILACPWALQSHRLHVYVNISDMCVYERPALIEGWVGGWVNMELTS